MNKYLATIAGVVLSTQALADTASNAAATQNQQTASTASAANQGNAQTLVQQASPGLAYSGQYAIKSAPPVSAPALSTTLTETCMGSTTGGVSVLGVGVSAGSTWKDEECIRRLNARELAQTLKEFDAAKELLCGNPEINEVYKALNRPCLLTASSSTAIPGGAQPQWRERVNPRPAYVSNVGDSTAVANTKTNPDRPVSKEEAAATLEAKITAANAARAYLKGRGY